MSDGKIEFDVKIDTTGFDEYSKTLDKMRKKAENHQKKLNELDKEIAKNRKIKDSANASPSLKAEASEKLRALVEESAQLGEQFEELNANIAKAEPYEQYAEKGKKAIEKLNKEIEKQKLNIQSGVNPDTASFEKSKIVIQQLQQEASKYAQLMGQGMPDVGSSLQERIDGIANAQLENAETYRSGEIKRKEIEKTQKMAQKEIQQSAKLLQKEIEKDARLKEKEMQRLAKQKEKEITRNAELERKENERIAKEKEKQSNDGVAKAVTKRLTGVASLFKTRLKRMMITAVINGFSSGMNAFIKESKEAKAAMDGIQTSWSTMCNAMGSAIGQLLPVVSSVFSAIVDWITIGINALAKFIAMLSGKSSYQKAIKSNKKLAKAVGGVGKKAKEATDEEKKSLASFDEINQLNLSDKQEESSSGGGGASGDLSEGLYETVPIVDGLSERMKGLIEEFNRLKDLFKEGFFDGLGDNWQTTVDGIKSDLETIRDSLGRIFDSPEVTDSMHRFTDSLVYNLGVVSGAVAGIGLNIGAGYIGGIAEYISNSEEFLKIAISQAFEKSASIMDWVGVAFSVAEKISEAFNSEWAQRLIGNIISLCVDPIITGFDLLLMVVDSALTIIMTPLEENAETIELLFEGIFEAFNSLLEPIVPVVKDFFAWVLTSYDVYVKPVVEKFTEAYNLLFKNYLNRIVNVHLPRLINACKFVGNTIAIGVQFLVDLMKTAIETVFTILDGLLDFIIGVFTGDWERAWEGVKNIFKGVFNGIVGIAESCINAIVRILNSLSFDVPEWIPGLGGKHFGFNIAPVSIPRLATGTVVPPNAGEFMAILGDNKQETEVVSPLSTMKQALSEALAEYGGGSNNITIKFGGDLAELARLLQPEIQAENRRVGMDLVIE